MNIDIKKVKINVTMPRESLHEVRDAVCEEGAGIIGNYSNCTISTKCIGTFKVLKRLREVHPYEEPAINIIPLIDEDNF